ncbi:MAG: DUF4349 domain-containing protein [Dehalococcoidia bacterium]
MNIRWMAAGVLAVSLLFAACGDDDDNDGGVSLSRGVAGATSAPNTSRSSTGAEAPATGGATDTGGGAPLPSIDSGRKIIFTATMELNASDVGRAFNDASSLATGNGGYIEKSAFSNDPNDNTKRSATLTIRVPAQNYDSLLASLRTMNGVGVVTEGSNSNEVTEQYIDLQSNQRNLERTEQQYLELLKQAKSIQEVLTVQDRLTSVRSQIEQIQGRLKVLDQRIEFATINLTVSPVVARVEDKPKDSDWSLRGVLVGSFEQSVEAARYVAAGAIVLGVAMAWLVVPLSLGLLAVLRFRKRPATDLPPPASPA